MINRWTSEETQFLYENYLGYKKNILFIAETLGKTYNSVRSKAKREKLCANNSRHWNSTEHNKLVQLAQKYSLGETAKKLGRTYNSVNKYAHRNNISFQNNKDGWYTQREISRLLGVHHRWIQDRIKNGTLKASLYNGSSHKKSDTSNETYKIREKDLKNFIRTYPGDLNGKHVDMVFLVDILAGIKYVNYADNCET